MATAMGGLPTLSAWRRPQLARTRQAAFGGGNSTSAQQTLCAHQHMRRRRGIIAAASAKAAQLLAEGKRIYESGDRLAAMGVYEAALKEGPALSREQRLAAMYGMVAVHASFGDVELAQMALRDAVYAGLDFEAAREDPDLPEISSSPQIVIQLSRFNKQLLRGMTDRAAETADMVKRAAKSAVARGGGGSMSTVPADADLSKLLGGPRTSAQIIADGGLDASPAAIAKRVLLVVLAGSALGIILFYAGLEYMFPQI